jgi:hypothetical protein
MSPIPPTVRIPGYWCAPCLTYGQEKTCPRCNTPRATATGLTRDDLLGVVEALSTALERNRAASGGRADGGLDLSYGPKDGPYGMGR